MDIISEIRSYIQDNLDIEIKQDLPDTIYGMKQSGCIEVVIKLEGQEIASDDFTYD